MRSPSTLHFLAAGVLALAALACGSEDPGPGDGASDAGVTDSAAGPDLCDRYCDNALANCNSGATKLYPDRATCRAACAVFPQTGAPGDTTGNSVHCRTYHAGAPAQMDPAAHCAHAAAHGGGVCGDPCEAYCDQVVANCPGTYPARNHCLAACEAFPRAGAALATSGDSVECRTYHASFPAAGDPRLHCPHAAPHGGTVCGSYCDAYCDQALANCVSLYPDRPACLAACAAIPSTGTATATAGNSIQCRIYHASFPAAGAPTTHCPHAAALGGGVCGGPCESYCDQVMANCSGANSAFPDRPACLAACAVMPALLTDTATAGNSVDCRTYHASFPARGNPALHCPHASTNGGGVCGGVCEAYCDQAQAHCTGAAALYPGRAACLTACGAFPAGGWQDTAGNSAECRTYHASFPAAADAPVHCPHASPGGGGVCQ